MIEIEVKASVEDPKQLERSIIEFGATPIGLETQAIHIIMRLTAILGRRMKPSGSELRMEDLF